MFTVHLENLPIYEQTSEIIKQSKLNRYINEDSLDYKIHVKKLTFWFLSFYCSKYNVAAFTAYYFEINNKLLEFDNILYFPILFHIICKVHQQQNKSFDNLRKF